MTAATNKISGHDGSLPHKNKQKPSVLPARAIHFAKTGMAPRSRQHCNNGPNLGCDNNHDSSRLEDLAKQATARIRKGVVGRTGRNIPIKPAATKVSPRNR